DRTKPVRTELIDALHHPGEQAVGRLPLVDARAAEPGGGDADRHFVNLVQPVAERRLVAASLRLVGDPGLRIVGKLPVLAAEGGDHAGGLLRLELTRVGRVRLSGSDEDLADAEPLDRLLM